MKLIDGFKNLPTKKKVIIISAAVAVIAAVVVLCVFLNKGLYANTMRLLKIEGTVSIEDANGNERPVIDNVRFNSGEALSTGADGLASVGLDDTKIVTLESDSRVEFTKSRNMLELNLTQGGLYFEVTEHLEPDETFDIRTSTMTVGIRGTSGYVFYDDQGRESLVITDGCVHVIAKNPETGEIIETDVQGGFSVKVYLYDETREEGSIEFFLDEVDEDEIYDKNVFKCHNSKLKPKLPHHLKTPPWHGAPNDVLVVLVGEVVAAQLDAELLQLLAKGNMMQHIRRKVVGKELLFVVGGAAATRHFYGVA